MVEESKGLQAGDVVEVLVANVLGQVPVVGSTLAGLFGANLTRHTRENLERTLRSFGRRIRRLEVQGRELAQVDPDEAAELFKTVMMVAFRTHREERLEAAAKLLASGFLAEGEAEHVPFSELDFFGRALERISGRALQALEAMARSRFRDSSVGGISAGTSLGHGDAYAACCELEGMGFALSLEDERLRESIVKGQLSKQPGYFARQDHEKEFRLSAAGQRFARYVLVDEEPEDSGA